MRGLYKEEFGYYIAFNKDARTKSFQSLGVYNFTEKKLSIAAAAVKVKSEDVPAIVIYLCIISSRMLKVCELMALFSSLSLSLCVLFVQTILLEHRLSPFSCVNVAQKERLHKHAHSGAGFSPENSPLAYKVS